MAEQQDKTYAPTFWSSTGWVAPDEPEEKSSGSDKELNKQISVAGKLESALSFLRTTARTNDYFTGYSLNEILQERIDIIGENNDETTATVGESTKMTMIATLNQLLVDTVGEAPKHEGGAIQAALDLKEIKDIPDEEEFETFND